MPHPERLPLPTPSTRVAVPSLASTRSTSFITLMSRRLPAGGAHVTRISAWLSADARTAASPSGSRTSRAMTTPSADTAEPYDWSSLGDDDLMLVQVVAFGLGLTVLLLLAVVRNDLLAETYTLTEPPLRALRKVIPDKSTRILIYCNNNFKMLNFKKLLKRSNKKNSNAKMNCLQIKYICVDISPLLRLKNLCLSRKMEDSLVILLL